MSIGVGSGNRPPLHSVNNCSRAGRIQLSCGAFAKVQRLVVCKRGCGMCQLAWVLQVQQFCQQGRETRLQHENCKVSPVFTWQL